MADFFGLSASSTTAAAAPAPEVTQEQKILLCSLSGDKFKDLFYSVCDSQREQLHQFFLAHSVVVWEGTAVTGLESIQEFFKRVLPSTSHNVKSVDVQPIFAPGVAETATPSMMVVVTGDVEYGMKATTQGFHHTFVIERDPASTDTNDKHYVASAVFRSHKPLASGAGGGSKTSSGSSSSSSSSSGRTFGASGRTITVTTAGRPRSR